MKPLLLSHRPSSPCKENDTRLDMFAWKQRSHPSIPHAVAASLEHVRSAFQTGHVWAQAYKGSLAFTKSYKTGFANWSKNIWITFSISLPALSARIGERLRGYLTLSNAVSTSQNIL